MSIYDQLIAEGMEKGLSIGKLEGKLEGISEGIEKGIEKTILNAFDNQISLEMIRIISGESLEKINIILERNGRI